ncbi:putative short chain dehydrogenase [Trypanosoma theileri]|uniref:Putative short chain dehydrogenase n=1 Tax=Trypanosoma theileri TaxID=67003 RepID=A0A1X0P099_9TRYP|nr:putative short chain dehydrogenase [Trypanosoma theileri]ORC90153.1 putative short chain dehydrogenase [Trypanosoma theileri]
MFSKVACVTGANKGIGFEITKKLARDGFAVIMACRDLKAAKEAESKIKTAVSNAHIEHVCLDLAVPESASKAAVEVKKLFPEGIDVLINNAGFAYHCDSPEPFHNQAVQTIKINYYGTVAVCEAIMPLIKDGGRLVNISSMSGSLTILSKKELIAKWKGCNSKESIESLLHEFIELTKVNGKHLTAGWPDSAYGVSKLAVTTYTRVIGHSTPRIHIFSCCPGHCQTTMSTFTGSKTAEQGADTPVWLATSEEALLKIPQGGFATERRHAPE